MDSGLWKESKIIRVKNGTTVFEVLNETFDVDYKIYPGMGIFVTSINNVTQNSTHFWIYFVNEKPANVGADSFILTENSNITWKLLSSEESMKIFKTS